MFNLKSMKKTMKPKKKGLLSGKLSGKFKGFGKSSKKGANFAGNLKSGGISPSTDEFDSMLSKASGKSSGGFAKKSMFGRKKKNAY